MKTLIKKTAITFILLTFLTLNVLANCETPPPCGDGQCPKQCSLIDMESTSDSDKDQELDTISDILIKLFEKIGILF